MSYYSYAGSRKNELKDGIDPVLEELDVLGYSVCEKVLPSQDVKKFRHAVDHAWKEQLHEFGEKKLRQLHEWGTARLLLHYDASFSRLILHPVVLKVIDRKSVV